MAFMITSLALVYPRSRAGAVRDAAGPVGHHTNDAAVRSAVGFDHLLLNAVSRVKLDPGIYRGGWPVPVLLQVGQVVVVSLALLSRAVSRFTRTE